MKDDSCLGPLIPVAYTNTGSGGDGAVNSSDSASLAEPDEIDYADYAVTAATSETVTRAPSVAPSADSSLTTISREELKGALLSGTHCAATRGVSQPSICLCTFS